MVSYSLESSADKPRPDKPGQRVVNADTLRTLGLALCKPDPGEKKPTYKNWPTRTLEPDDFAPGDLYGILGGPLSDYNQPGHALVPVDLDDAQAIARADEFLPATGMEEGRPGKPRDHRYFLVPLSTIPDWARSTATQAAPAAQKAKGHPGPWKKAFNHERTEKRLIDFIGTGGQIVCPSPGGNERQWVGGAPGQPAVVPFPVLWEAVCKLAVACGAKDESPHNGKATSNTLRIQASNAPSVVDRAIKYLQKMPAAVSGERGHDHTFEAARVVVYGFDLGPDVGFRVLWDHYNPRCRPEWSEAELRHKCAQAHRVPFNKPRGWLLHEQNGHHATNGSGKHHDAKPPDAPEDDKAHLTDVGNSQRIFRRHGQDMRYCQPLKQYLVWDGCRFAFDDTGEAVRRAKDTQRALYQWATEQLAQLAKDADDEDEERKAKAAKLTKILQHALKWEDARRINASLEMFRSDVPIRPADMDRDPWLLNVRNGTIDLRTGQLRSHRREDLITKLAPVNYDPAATCPLWERCLDKWMDENRDLTDYLRRVVGYALTADVSEQVLFFLHGDGSNGKSTFLNIVKELLGDYAWQAVPELLTQRDNPVHSAERADLFGRRFVAISETEDGKRMAESLVKQLTGGEFLTAGKKYKDDISFPPTWKLFLASNHRPKVRGTDFAVWRRIQLIPFTVTIAEGDKDKNLPNKLKAEMPGILAWAVRGCLEWQRHGLADPEEVRLATEKYRAEQDTLSGFIADCCVVAEYARVQSKRLLEAYQEWTGDKHMTQAALRIRLNDKGFESKKGTGGVYFFHGIGLPAEADA